MAKKETRQALLHHRLAPKKRFGQNFLVHAATAQAIAQLERISKDDVIVEVGVGLGALSIPLAKRARKVIGIEIDSGIIRMHQEENNLPANVSLMHNDILKVDFKKLQKDCDGPIKCMANLPYSISNPFIFKLVENKTTMDWAVIMLQKEVAERLTASPSTKAYGIPTVLLGACASVTKLMHLAPHEFHPQPKIDSLVIRIDFSSPSEDLSSLPGYNFALFQQVVRSAFAQRRKTIVNNIGNGPFFDQSRSKKDNKECAAQALQSAAIAPGERAENLTIADFIRLTVAIEAGPREQHAKPPGR